MLLSSLDSAPLCKLIRRVLHKKDKLVEESDLKDILSWKQVLKHRAETHSLIDF